MAETASVPIGRSGGTFVTIGVMISTCGWVSGGILNVPPLACSLATQGDVPGFLGKLHPRFNTPAIAIVLYASFKWLLAATGVYLGIAALGGCSLILIYAGPRAALTRLRRRQPQIKALRLPFGRAFAVAGIIISLAALTQLHLGEALLIGITALIATVNWWWAKRRELVTQRVSPTVVQSDPSL